jgi:acetyl esterase
MASDTAFEIDVHELEYQPAGVIPFLVSIYQPRGAGPFPTIVDVHGGAYHIGDRLNNAPIDRGLAERGILVAALDFRQSQHAPYPASIQDVNLGIRWLKQHAAEYHGQENVGGLGSSSGGNQILLCALRPNDPRYTTLQLPDGDGVDAQLSYVVGCWPVADPLERYMVAKRRDPHDDGALAYEAYFRSEDAMADGNPKLILDRDEEVHMAPIFIVQGTADDIVSPTMQEQFMASYRRRGGTTWMKTFEGMGHTFIPRHPEAAKSIEALDAIAAFIKEHAS